jgi:hypothetical protein
MPSAMTDDDDTYSDDPSMDDVLMYAPDTWTCRQCGGDALDDGSGPRHVEAWITDHVPSPVEG